RPERVSRFQRAVRRHPSGAAARGVSPHLILAHVQQQRVVKSRHEIFYRTNAKGVSAMIEDKTAWIEAEIASLREQGLFAHIRTLSSPQGAWLVVDGQRVLNFSSNNYLGLSHHPLMVDDANRAMDTHGVGPEGVRTIARSMAI